MTRALPTPVLAALLCALPLVPAQAQQEGTDNSVEYFLSLNAFQKDLFIREVLIGRAVTFLEATLAFDEDGDAYIEQRAKPRELICMEPSQFDRADDVIVEFIEKHPDSKARGLETVIFSALARHEDFSCKQGDAQAGASG